MKDSIEISSDTAARVIECLESRIETCDLDLKAAAEGQKKILERKAALVETLAKLRTALAAVQATASPNGADRERRPQGYGVELIRQVLEAQPEGAGLTVAEIERKTGVNHATVFRTLKNPKRNQGRFVSNDGKRWRLSDTLFGTGLEAGQPTKTVNAHH